MESNQAKITPFYYTLLQREKFNALLRIKTHLGPEVLLYSMITVCLSFAITVLCYYFLDSDILVTASTFGGVFLMLFYLFIKLNNFFVKQDRLILSQLIDQKHVTLLSSLLSFQEQIKQRETTEGAVNELFLFVFNSSAAENLTAYRNSGDNILLFATRLPGGEQDKIMRYFTVNG